MLVATVEESSFIFFLSLSLKLLVCVNRKATSQTIAWCCHHLSENPQVQEKLFAEVDAALGKGEDPQWGVHIEGKLPYLNAVIKETLRLSPAVPMDPKVVLEDDVLPSGHKLKKGWNFSWTQWDMSRHSGYWERPEEFKPERWLVAPADPTIPAPPANNAPPWCPFQFGPRVCLGMRMALADLEASLMLLVKHHRFSPANNNNKPYPKVAITIMGRDGIDVMVHSR